MSANFPRTPHQYNLLKLALVSAYKKQEVFTQADFSEKNNLKDNRHLAAALRSMVDDGVLKCWSIQFADTRRRDVYSRLPFSDDVEQLNRLADQVMRYAKQVRK